MIRADMEVYKMVQPKILVRYEEEVDLVLMRFDHMSAAKMLSGETMATSITLSEVLICNLQSGTYHVVVAFPELPGSEVNLWYTTLLKPRNDYDQQQEQQTLEEDFNQQQVQIH